MKFSLDAAVELPLLDLFTRLRQAGLPLGMDEYQLLLYALQGGFGLPDRTTLARLCKTLWVKSADDERLFDYHFDQSIPLQVIVPDRMPVIPQPQFLPDQPEPSIRSGVEAAPVVNTSIANSPIPSRSPTASEWMLKIDDEVEVAKAVSQRISENADSTYYYPQSDEYFPITRRQMKQSWRYLRRTTREGPAVELDVKATVNDVGRRGVLLKPLFVPRRVNRTELLLLIDQGGSMVPFHALSRRLAETAIRGGRVGKPDICYFHNCPAEYLYRDPSHLNAEVIQDILKPLHANRACVLIFSDAGAARGGFSFERINITEEFLHELKQHVRYVAWLNPVLRSRWQNTTAEEIMRLIPMFDVSRRGLDDAISVLRGHTSHLYTR